MADTITKDQFDELWEEQTYDIREFHKLLEEYTGIIARPYTAYTYYVGDDWVGDSEHADLDDLLRNAYIEVIDNA